MAVVIINPFILGASVTPGDQTFTSNGTFTVPAYNTLTVTLFGPGGGGGSFSGVGANANNTVFNSSGQAFGLNLIARGGNGGGAGGAGSPGSGGAGGTASNGDTNNTGGTGDNGNGGGGDGGDCPGGGSGGSGGSFPLADGGPGQVPGGGGGGSGPENEGSSEGGGGAGSGARCIKTFTPGQLTVGAMISVTVPSGGAGDINIGNEADGGNGARGQAFIEWS